MLRYFEGSAHADLYKKYRRPTPASVVQRVLEYLEEQLPRPHDLAVDVGCGSGQNTMSFAPFFKNIIGVDVSESQIEEALKTPKIPDNVTFQVGAAESLPVRENSVRLVVGSASFHWLDFDKFYKEVDRVLMPNGIVAAITYTFPEFLHPTKGKELNELIRGYFEEHLKPYTHERGSYPINGYQDLPMPSYGDVVKVGDLYEDVTLTLIEAAMFTTTLSSFQQAYRENPQKTLSTIENVHKRIIQILEVTTPEEANVVLRFKYVIIMCRKPDVKLNTVQ